jgi:hypothetical protein
MAITTGVETMARAITKYVASDGSEWSHSDHAEERDQLCATVSEIMAPLGERPKLDEEHYHQHDPEVVIACRVAILKVCRKLYPTFKVFYHEPLSEVHPRSVVGRLLDDCGGPLNTAWGRFMCTDDQGREWQQPYYVANPPANAVAL